MVDDTKIEPPVVDRARKLHCDDNCEIDAYPEISVGEAGAWVRAWVWVPDEFYVDVEDD